MTLLNVENVEKIKLLKTWMLKMVKVVWNVKIEIKEPCVWKFKKSCVWNEMKLNSHVEIGKHDFFKKANMWNV